MTWKPWSALRPGRGTTLYVAASNANPLSKLLADYVCTGTNDEAQVQLALNALPSSPAGGKVMLSEGVFNFSNGASTARNNTVIEGSGWGTIIRCVDGAGVNGNILFLTGSKCGVTNLVVDGNKASTATRTNMILIRLVGTDDYIDNIAAINSAGSAIQASGTANRVFNCVLQNNASIGVLFDGTTPFYCDDTIAEGSGANNFVTQIAGAKLANCVARTSPNGFYIGGADTHLVGCLAVSNTGAGFTVAATRARMVGCEARSNTSGGFVVTTGGTFARLKSCISYLNTGAGISIGQTDAIIDGCDVIQNTQYGITTTSHRGAIRNNHVIDNGTASAATYPGIIIQGDDNFIEGNFVRRGSAAANQQERGIWVVSGTNNMVGINDTYDGGTAAYFQDSATNTRRVAKIQLNYNASTNLHNGTAVAAATQTDILANQSFRVDNYNSVIVIISWGALLTTGAAANTQFAVAPLLDGGSLDFPAMGGASPAAGNFGFSLASIIVVENLTVGTHNIRYRFLSSAACSLYLRASGNASYEDFGIQVLEFAR